MPLSSDVEVVTAFKIVQGARCFVLKFQMAASGASASFLMGVQESKDQKEIRGARSYRMAPSRVPGALKSDPCLWALSAEQSLRTGLCTLLGLKH